MEPDTYFCAECGRDLAEPWSEYDPDVPEPFRTVLCANCYNNDDTDATDRSTERSWQ